MITYAELRQMLVYDPDTGTLTWLHRASKWFPSDHAAAVWNARYAGTKAMTTRNRGGYLAGSLLGRTYMAHRVAWCLLHGSWPAGMEVDHINGQRRDNRAVNLRLATHAENARNRRPNIGKQYRGTAFDGRRWYARCQANGQLHQRSGFKSELEAAIAYNELAAGLHGEFARLNTVLEA